MRKQKAAETGAPSTHDQGRTAYHCRARSVPVKEAANVAALSCRGTSRSSSRSRLRCGDPLYGHEHGAQALEPSCSRSRRRIRQTGSGDLAAEYSGQVCNQRGLLMPGSAAPEEFLSWTCRVAIQAVGAVATKRLIRLRVADDLPHGHPSNASGGLRRQVAASMPLA